MEGREHCGGVPFGLAAPARSSARCSSASTSAYCPYQCSTRCRAAPKRSSSWGTAPLERGVRAAEPRDTARCMISTRQTGQGRPPLMSCTAYNNIAYKLV